MVTVDPAAANVGTHAKFPPKPRRPRPDGLTYTRAELAYVLGVSLVQLGWMKHRLQAPLAWRFADRQSKRLWFHA
jgi:hypothetical protein